MSHAVALSSKFDAADELFWKLVADPRWGLSEHDRETFHAFLTSVGREAAERAHSARPVRDRAKRIIEHPEVKALAEGLAQDA